MNDLIKRQKLIAIFASVYDPSICNNIKTQYRVVDKSFYLDPESTTDYLVIISDIILNNSHLTIDEDDDNWSEEVSIYLRSPSMTWETDPRYQYYSFQASSSLFIEGDHFYKFCDDIIDTIDTMNQIYESMKDKDLSTEEIKLYCANYKIL